MATLVTTQLQNGLIYGDALNREYLYLPAGECGAASPLLVYEHDGIQDDVQLTKAAELITRRSLKPVRHPRLGTSSF